MGNNKTKLPEPEELTDKEKIVYDILCSDVTPPNGQHWEGFVAQKIVKALAQPEPEPVAWEYCGALFYDKEEVFAWHERGDIGSTPPKPLYTAPPQQECMPDDLIATYEKGVADGKAKPKPWDNQVLITDEYERGFIDGMQKQMQSSVDKAVNKMAKREWQRLTDDEVKEIYRATEMKVEDHWRTGGTTMMFSTAIYQAIEAKLKEKNSL